MIFLGQLWDSGRELPDAPSGTDRVTYSSICSPTRRKTPLLHSCLIKQGANTLARFDYNPSTRPFMLYRLRQAACEELNPGALTRSVDYTFDSLNRLSKEVISTEAPNTRTLAPSTTINAVGNRAKRQSVPRAQAHQTRGGHAQIPSDRPP
jgi:hypothetical protein